MSLKPVPTIIQIIIWSLYINFPSGILLTSIVWRKWVGDIRSLCFLDVLSVAVRSASMIRGKRRHYQSVCHLSSCLQTPSSGTKFLVSALSVSRSPWLHLHPRWPGLMHPAAQMKCISTEAVLTEPVSSTVNTFALTHSELFILLSSQIGDQTLTYCANQSQDPITPVSPCAIESKFNQSALYVSVTPDSDPLILWRFTFVSTFSRALQVSKENQSVQSAPNKEPNVWE